ncbi:MAG: glycosyltransferase family 4 protein [bacterium]|nr:glycosyltransferase family 4 protein [bacterium]
MQVCFLNHNLNISTGAGRFGIELISRLKRRYPDFKPVVLTAVDSSHEWEEPILYSNAVRLLFALPRIRAVFKKCDVIHALDGFPYGVIAAIASCGLGKKLIITAVGTGAIQAFYNPIKGALLRWAYRRADYVVAVSSYTKWEVLSHVGGLNILVIHHGIDADEFRMGADEALTDEERRVIQRMKPYILSVGGGKRRKGYEYSFPAFAEIGMKFPNLHYAVVGHDIEHTPARALGIEDKVSCFFGVRWPFVKALYYNAELFMLLPYDDRGDVEGFGFVFLEAAASGIPVLGTYGNGAEDAVDNGKNGFLVEPRNFKAAAEKAVEILSNPILKNKFAEGSINFAKNMSWDKVLVRYAEIYKKL